ncbi:hypothetical protein ACFQU2_12365 [Siccirubricoccus deserti]
MVAAGQALLVDDDFALDDTVWLQPSPGHSPCHCCVNIASRGQRAVVTGDLMHHALQVREPGWSTVFDWDATQAAASRRGFLAEVAETPTLVLPIHFPGPTAGRVKGGAAGFDWHSSEPERETMARVPYLSQADLKPEDQPLLARDISLHKALVNNPGAARAFSGLGGYIRHKSVLNPRLRELAILQVGWLARSPMNGRTM